MFVTPLGSQGASFGDEPLDMRLDPGRLHTTVLLNTLSRRNWPHLLYERRGARTLGASRFYRARPLATTATGGGRRARCRARLPRRLHVATRTFLALRVAVNDEVDTLAQALPDAAEMLEVGGRLGVISFHSGEDRVVKHAFRALASRGFEELQPSPRPPTDDEVRANPRARSAKLRVLERLA
jgi:16S rRNA (cytosine1402-N4)-methyltransferase